MAREQFEKLIGEGKLQQALDGMLQYSDQNKHLTEFRQNVFFLKARLRDLQKQHFNSVLSEDEYVREQNKLILAMLSALSDIPTKSNIIREELGRQKPEQPNSPPPPKTYPKPPPRSVPPIQNTEKKKPASEPNPPRAASKKPAFLRPIILISSVVVILIMLYIFWGEGQYEFRGNVQNAVCYSGCPISDADVRVNGKKAKNLSEGNFTIRLTELETRNKIKVEIFKPGFHQANGPEFCNYEKGKVYAFKLQK